MAMATDRKLEIFEEYLPRAEYSRDMHTCRYRLTQKSGDEPKLVLYMYMYLYGGSYAVVSSPARI